MTSRCWKSSWPASCARALRYATVACYGLTCACVVSVAGREPQRVATVNAVNPTGISTYSAAPSPQAEVAFERLLASGKVRFWDQLLDPVNVRRFYVARQAGDEARIEQAVQRQLL